jgi:hypothetical protein
VHSLIDTLIFFLIQTHPSSSLQEQRGFIRCLLSPVACKRSLSTTDEMENSPKVDIVRYLQICLALNQPVRHCLDQPLHIYNKLIK